MLHRSLAVRAVLAVAVLTTVATSAPLDIVLSETTEATLGPGTTPISVFANRAAVNHADWIELEIKPLGDCCSTQLGDRDPAIPIGLAEIRDGVTLRFDVEELCARDRDCDAGFTVEIPAEQRDAIQVGVTLTFARAGDGAFLFPDNPPFPEDAVLEVRVGP